MLGQTAIWGLLSALMVGNFVVGIIHPILMPEEMTQAVIYGLGTMFFLDGIFPIYTLIKAFIFIIGVCSMYVFVKILFSFISAKPDIE